MKAWVEGKNVETIETETEVEEQKDEKKIESFLEDNSDEEEESEEGRFEIVTFLEVICFLNSFESA